VLTDQKAALAEIARQLLAHEVLDADQVRKIASGQPIDEAVPRASAAPTGTPEDDEARRRQRERPSVVPPLPPLQKPLPQE
jgi:hypothetical protein